MNAGRLVVLGGLPASGKTTLARGLAAAMRAVHLRIDTIEQALRRCDALRDGDIGPAGYVVAYGVAADNLRQGHVVIADAVNGIEEVRSAWRAVALRTRASVDEIEVVCSDREEHRHRVESRTVDIPDLDLPSWDDVVARVFEPWSSATRMDTAGRTVRRCVDELLSRLERAGG